MVARLGTQAIVANQVAMNVIGLSFSFGDGLSIAAVALIGESLGKGCHADAIKYVKICSIFGSFICNILGVGLVGIWIGVLLDQIVRAMFTA